MFNYFTLRDSRGTDLTLFEYHLLLVLLSPILLAKMLRWGDD